MRIVTKAEFAAMKGRAPSAVSNWIADGRITPAALIGTGVRAKICVEQADRDLVARLDLRRQDAQSVPIAPTATPDTANAAVADDVRRLRAEQLELQNQKLREEAHFRSGRYVLAAAVEREIGRLAADMLAVFDGAVPTFANAMVAARPTTARDAVHLLRREWREIRAKVAAVARLDAESIPRLIEDTEDDLVEIAPPSPDATG